MSLNVISNYAANVAHRYLSDSDMAATSSLAKLSSGQRIVSAKDDAAGLAIGSRLALQVTALQQASTNATQATSMLQVADGALSQISDVLARMKTLAVQAQSGQLGTTERSMIQTEYGNLLSEIDRISNDTTFNGVTLLAGTTAVTTSLNQQGVTGGTDYVNAAHGFDNIAFNPTTSGVWQFSYDSTNNVLTAKNMATGQSEGVALSFNSIAAGATQDVKFVNSGITVTLNSAFNFAANIAPSAASAFTSDTAGSIEDSSIKVTGEDSAAVATITDNTVSVDATTATAAVLTITTSGGTATITDDLTVVGTHTVSLVDSSATGGTVTLSFNVTAAFTSADAAASFTVGDLGTMALGTSATSATSYTYQVGPGQTAGTDTITVSLSQINTTALGLNTTSVSGADATNANTASAAIDSAVNTLNTARASVGASQSRLGFAAANLATNIENADAARSSLLDLDIAAEMTTFTSKQILEQTGISMLAQANRMPQNLLKLFQ